MMIVLFTVLSRNKLRIPLEGRTLFRDQWVRVIAAAAAAAAAAATSAPSDRFTPSHM